ncbi:MAG: hypothetical protein INF43_02180 [Alphaproteobacteria bacterium]|jgi:hypothetical protein|nr:hypothetical protein [Alphaproteobacteria bacterium]
MSKPQKPSLAVDLARQAAAAALAEVQESPTTAAGSTSRAWQPATLPQGFALAPALQQAVRQVAGHLGQWLHHEGLEVATAPQAPVRSETTAPAVQVREQGGGRVVRGYSESAVLGLFASQQQRTGVVVDGQV